MYNMNQTTESFTWKTLFFTGAFLAVLSSCGGGGGGGIPDPTPDPDPTPEVTTGDVTFTPDWGSLPATSLLRFHFYPASGAVVTKDGDAAGCKATLEHGTYRVLAYNTEASGVTFENTDSYDKAAVRVTPVEVPTRSSSILNLPGNIYTLSMEGMAVEKGGSSTPKSTVKPLVSTVNLTFTVSNSSFVKTLGGYINGVLPSLLLCTGKPDEASVASAKECGMVFDIPLNGGEGNASFTTLGMADPKNGSAYSCLLTLGATTTDGQEWEVTANLSNVITQVLEYNGGIFPTSEPVNLKISVNATTVGLQADVKSWDIGGKGEVIVKPQE